MNLYDRVREVRVSAFGARGQAKFAVALGISPSTYSYYERSRIPPLPVLLRISEVGKVDLRWLLTGQFRDGASGAKLSADHARLLSRMTTVLPQQREAAAALEAVLDLLESRPAVEDTSDASPGPAPKSEEQGSSNARIPVLGRSAAGVPHFWAQPEKTVDLMRSVLLGTAGGTWAFKGTLQEGEGRTPHEPGMPVHLIQLSDPVKIGELNVAEFLDCPSLTDRWPNAFALRIDGDSMHPSFAHGDLVILSPGIAARQGKPAVVQLRNQIGVTCKLFYRDRDDIRLIPINEQVGATKHKAEDVVWALEVLYRVRISG